ncbi:hypothetical protein [Burkholderia sp. WP9]|uniref:hypothetical protein n=1 Tax=Burkholderia sp. WP9 TaxID=1500263 RepID=UPI0015A72330|nr:hypothetical protein [Burkholderia sp. WP9]
MPAPANDKVTGTTEKRVRGRPRKPDALSNAERQAAWRTRHGTRTKSVTVTKNIPLPAEAPDALVRECEQLRGEPARPRRELEAISRGTPSNQAPADVAAVLGRLPRPEDTASGERRLRLTMNGTRIFALERLVAHFGLSRRAVIERLTDWADDTLARSLYDDEAAFNRYIDRARN